MSPHDHEDGRPSPAKQGNTRQWLRRHWRHVLVGAVPGILLGVTTTSEVSKGGLSAALTPYFLGVLIGLPFVLLLVASALAKRPGPAVAACALGGSFLIALIVAPPAGNSGEGCVGDGGCPIYFLNDSDEALMLDVRAGIHYTVGVPAHSVLAVAWLMVTEPAWTMTVVDSACKPRAVIPIDLNKRLLYASPTGATTLVNDAPWGYGLRAAKAAPYATRSPACP